ncbi:MAG: HAMP domain-containing protein [Pirellulales bacterium]|nr:HAMP domain-containing protein [Pirellulales bacterium]
MIALRHRIALTLLPLLLLVAIFGGFGIALLSRVGGRIDQILRENYASVIYMERLRENLERMDSAFQFALAGREPEARKQFDDNWRLFLEHYDAERRNITLPGEGELVARLNRLGEGYHHQGMQFFGSTDAEFRRNAYFDQGGLLATFNEMKDAADQIARMNHDNMTQANREARQTARSSLVWFGVGAVLVTLLGVFLARHTINTILRPITSVTESVAAIGAGDLDQLVPVVSNDELGQLAGAVNTMARQLRDYRQSQKARLLRIQQAAQATLNSFPDPVLVVDRDCQIEMANPAARRVLGLPIADRPGAAPIVWRPPAVLEHPLTEALQAQQAFLPDGFDQAVSLRCGTGERVYLPRILPISEPYGGTLGAAILLADVTRFQLLDQIKSDLVATVSHELKTPLGSISMAIHLLLEEAVGPLNAKQLELLIEARTGSERLLAMINNLLDLARLEKGASHLVVRPESTAALLQAAAELVQQRAADQGVEIVTSAAADLPPIAVDSHVIGHAFRNLLDNALTYTEQGGRIVLSAALGGDQIQVTVSDTGVGIPPEHLPHVFDRFFRIPGQSRGIGTGLGLAIVREIVIAHGGGIECASKPGVGTTFRMTLPVWHEPPRELRAADDHAAPTSDRAAASPS